MHQGISGSEGPEQTRNGTRSSATYAIHALGLNVGVYCIWLRRVARYGSVAASDLVGTLAKGRADDEVPIRAGIPDQAGRDQKVSRHSRRTCSRPLRAARRTGHMPTLQHRRRSAA